MNISSTYVNLSNCYQKKKEKECVREKKMVTFIFLTFLLKIAEPAFTFFHAIFYISECSILHSFKVSMEVVDGKWQWMDVWWNENNISSFCIPLGRCYSFLTWRKKVKGGISFDYLGNPYDLNKSEIKFSWKRLLCKIEWKFFFNMHKEKLHLYINNMWERTLKKGRKMSKWNFPISHIDIYAIHSKLFSDNVPC